jgi:hypothetical protein
VHAGSDDLAHGLGDESAAGVMDDDLGPGTRVPIDSILTNDHLLNYYVLSESPQGPAKVPGRLCRRPDATVWSISTSLAQLIDVVVGWRLGEAASGSDDLRLN